MWFGTNSYQWHSCWKLFEWARLKCESLWKVPCRSTHLYEFVNNSAVPMNNMIRPLCIWVVMGASKSRDYPLPTLSCHYTCGTAVNYRPMCIYDNNIHDYRPIYVHGGARSADRLMNTDIEFDKCVTRSWDRCATGILDQRSGDNVSQYPQCSTGLSQRPGRMWLLSKDAAILPEQLLLDQLPLWPSYGTHCRVCTWHSAAARVGTRQSVSDRASSAATSSNMEQVDLWPTTKVNLLWTCEILLEYVQAESLRAHPCRFLCRYVTTKYFDII